jgi:hypothetical protein
MTRKFFGLILALTLVMMLIPGMSPIWGERPVTAQGMEACRVGDYWLKTQAGNPDAPIWLVRAQDQQCIWSGLSPAMINPAGDCGRPEGIQPIWMVYSHNWTCDAAYCPHGLNIGGVPAWPDLPVGSGVTLCANGELYRGQVMEVVLDAAQRGIEPQTPFKCPTAFCGTLTTCYGLRSEGNYAIVRISYRRVR